MEPFCGVSVLLQSVAKCMCAVLRKKRRTENTLYMINLNYCWMGWMHFTFCFLLFFFFLVCFFVLLVSYFLVFQCSICDCIDTYFPLNTFNNILFCYLFIDTYWCLSCHEDNVFSNQTFILKNFTLNKWKLAYIHFIKFSPDQLGFLQDSDSFLLFFLAPAVACWMIHFLDSQS